MISSQKLYNDALQLLEGHYATSGILPAIAGMPDYNKELSLHICQTLFEIVDQSMEKYKQTIQNLIRMSTEFLDLQSELEINGHYKYSSFAEVKADIIDNASVMEGGYLDALFISQSFWPNHNRILSFFIKNFCQDTQNAEPGKMLEVPCGSGVFSLEFLRLNKWEAVLCDLSEYSVAFSKKVLEHSNITNARFIHDNVFELNENEQFDKIICGELLEHLEDPEQLLEKLHRLLKADGRLFVTTAIWAAAIDHIYLFESARAVDEMLEKNFKFVKKLVLPLNPKANPNRERIPINYAAILMKK